MCVCDIYIFSQKVANTGFSMCQPQTLTQRKILELVLSYKNPR